MTLFTAGGAAALVAALVGLVRLPAEYRKLKADTGATVAMSAADVLREVHERLRAVEERLERTEARADALLSHVRSLEQVIEGLGGQVPPRPF